MLAADSGIDRLDVPVVFHVCSHHRRLVDQHKSIISITTRNSVGASKADMLPTWLTTLILHDIEALRRMKKLLSLLMTQLDCILCDKHDYP